MATLTRTLYTVSGPPEKPVFKAVRVRLGITDGTYTELLGGDLQPPMEVVTVITGVGSNRTTNAAGSGNPLMPQRGGGPGGAPGRGH